MPVAVKIQAGPEKIEAFLLDLSEYGVGVISPTPIAPGTEVKLEIPKADLPLPSKAQPGSLMRIEGRVAHSTDWMNRFRVGIAFTRIDDLDRFLIRQIVAPPERRRAPRIFLLPTSTEPGPS